MEQMKFKAGDKVVAIKKTIGHRDLESAASYYEQIERNQPYLFVNAVDESSTAEQGEPCYWCDAVRGMGDLYRESDLIAYTEEKSA